MSKQQEKPHERQTEKNQRKSAVPGVENMPTSETNRGEEWKGSASERI
ncbi:hypothetical protein [Peribacillus sp. SCS-155]